MNFLDILVNSGGIFSIHNRICNRNQNTSFESHSAEAQHVILRPSGVIGSTCTFYIMARSPTNIVNVHGASLSIKVSSGTQVKSCRRMRLRQTSFDS